MMNLNIMRKIVNDAILAEQKVTITMNDGYVLKKKRIVASDSWTIVTHDEWFIQWWEVYSVVLS